MLETSRTLLKNSVLAFAARTGGQAANALIFVFLAREYGAEAAGTYTLAARWFLLFLTLASWGLEALLIRELAARRSATNLYLANFGVLRLSGGIIGYVALAMVVAGLVDYDHLTTRFILLFTFSIVPEGMSRLIQAAFVAHERFVPPTIVVLAASAIRLLIAGAIIWQGGRLELLAALQAGTSLLSWLLFAVLLRHRFSEQIPTPNQEGSTPGSPWWQLLDWRFLSRQAKLSLPFALMEIFVTVEWQIDVVLASVYLPARAVGYYGSAIAIASLFYFALSAYSAAIYPAMARLYRNDREDLWRLYRHLVLYVVMAVLPLAAMSTGFAPALITKVFGDEFAAGILPLQWLIWSVAVRFLDEPNSRLTIIAGYQKVSALFLGSSMVLNILMNLLLIPKFGILGAAWARLLSTLLFVVLNGVFVYRRVSRINLVPLVGKLAIAIGVMAVVLHASQGATLWLKTTLGGASYLVALLLLRAIPREDQLRVREVAGRIWQRVRS